MIALERVMLQIIARNLPTPDQNGFVTINTPDGRLFIHQLTELGSLGFVMVGDCYWLQSPFGAKLHHRELGEQLARLQPAHTSPSVLLPTKQAPGSEPHTAPRIVERDGQTWVIAVDACNALDITQPSNVIGYVDDNNKTKIDVGQRGATPWFLNQAGVAQLVARQRRRRTAKKPKGRAAGKTRGRSRRCTRLGAIPHSDSTAGTLQAAFAITCNIQSQ